MDINWKNALKEIRAKGVRVNTSVKGCCPGCVDADSLNIKEGQPFVFQLSSRFDTELGGYLYHQDLAGTPQADEVMDILEAHGLEVEWDRSESKTIEVTIR